jgi:HEPN domain-containing protein
MHFGKISVLTHNRLPKRQSKRSWFSVGSFRKTHDLRGLLTVLESSGYPVPEEIRNADELTDYAVETRYPGLSEAVSVNEYRRAIALAELVLRWANEQVKSRRNRKRKT